jgi:hypothetical protein
LCHNIKLPYNDLFAFVKNFYCVGRVGETPPCKPIFFGDKLGKLPPLGSEKPNYFYFSLKIDKIEAAELTPMPYGKFSHQTYNGTIPIVNRTNTPTTFTHFSVGERGFLVHPTLYFFR